jgi:hypothetical protein
MLLQEQALQQNKHCKSIVQNKPLLLTAGLTLIVCFSRVDRALDQRPFCSSQVWLCPDAIPH